MSLRETTYTAEVAVQPQGSQPIDLKLTTFTAEVLIPANIIASRSLESTLDLDTSVVMVAERPMTVAATLDLVADFSATVEAGFITMDLDSALGLDASLATNFARNITLASALDLTADVVREPNVFITNIESSLAFLVVVLTSKTQQLNLESPLDLSIAVYVAQTYDLDLSSDIALFATAQERSVYLTISSPIDFATDLVVDTAVANRSLQSALGLNASISLAAVYVRSLPADPGDNLFLDASVVIASSSLPITLLSQVQMQASVAADQQSSDGFGARLGIDAEVSMVVERARSLSSGLGLTATMSIELVPSSSCFTKGFNPSGSNAPLPTGRIALAGGVTLRYPYATQTTEIILPSPEQGDTQDVNIARLNITTRGNVALNIPPDVEIVTETLNFTFEIEDSLRDSLLDFLNVSAGKEILLIDHYGTSWRGIITNPNADLVYTRRCVSTIQIQFQGTRE